MNVWWWIEETVFPASSPSIIAAIEQAGQQWVRYDENDPGSRPPEGACVIFWGSLGAAYTDGVARRWTPGAIGDPERFHCSAYHPHLGRLLANADAVFTTVRQFVDAPGVVLSTLERVDRVFVRPDSPLKPFSGRTLSIADLSLQALDHGYYYDDIELPILVSPARDVRDEWRFVIADGRVVAGSGYDAQRRARIAELPAAARELAERVAGVPWQAALLYVVDIGEVDGVPRVMELNPFSGADLLACNPAAVVSAAASVARMMAL